MLLLFGVSAWRMHASLGVVAMVISGYQGLHALDEGPVQELQPMSYIQGISRSLFRDIYGSTGRVCIAEGTL